MKTSWLIDVDALEHTFFQSWLNFKPVAAQIRGDHSSMVTWLLLQFILFCLYLLFSLVQFIHPGHSQVRHDHLFLCFWDQCNIRSEGGPCEIWVAFPCPHRFASQVPFPISPRAKTFYFHFITHFAIFPKSIFIPVDPPYFWVSPQVFIHWPSSPPFFHIMRWVWCVRGCVGGFFLVGWHFSVCVSACNISGAALTWMRHCTLIMKVC